MSSLGLIQLDSTTRPDWLNTCVTLYLVALAVECADATPRMDAESAAVLKKLTSSQDNAFLALAHELGNPERGFVSYAEYGMVILNQLAAYRLTQKDMYLTSARHYADEAIRLFWDADKPLPRASTKTDYYDVISSPDTLMLALLALHEHITKLDPRVEISDLIR